MTRAGAEEARRDIRCCSHDHARAKTILVSRCGAQAESVLAVYLRVDAALVMRMAVPAALFRSLARNHVHEGFAITELLPLSRCRSSPPPPAPRLAAFRLATTAGCGRRPRRRPTARTRWSGAATGTRASMHASSMDLKFLFFDRFG